MNEIVSKLFESRRLDEARKKVAIDSLLTSLKDRLSKVSGYYPRRVMIMPNYDEGCVDVQFRYKEDKFSIYPQRSKISNENSNKVVSVDSIDGAYIEGTKVYDAEGNLLGEALIKMKAVHNKSDYSESLDSAECKFNGKITSLQKLENYIKETYTEKG